MRIHFICRGNGLRSTMAEAYARSLGVPGLDVVSSGSNIAKYKGMPISPRALKVLQARGLEPFAKLRREQLTPARIDPADLIVCLNRRVFDEASAITPLPHDTIVWNVADMGEPPHVPENDAQAEQFAADMFDEITRNLDTLLRARRLI